MHKIKNISTYNATANQGQTSFILPYKIRSTSSLIVKLGGIDQPIESYSVLGMHTVEFSEPLNDGVAVAIEKVLVLNDVNLPDTFGDLNEPCLLPENSVDLILENTPAQIFGSEALRKEIEGMSVEFQVNDNPVASSILYFNSQGLEGI